MFSTALAERGAFVRHERYASQTLMFENDDDEATHSVHSRTRDQATVLTHADSVLCAKPDVRLNPVAIVRSSRR